MFFFLIETQFQKKEKKSVQKKFTKKKFFFSFYWSDQAYLLFSVSLSCSLIHSFIIIFTIWIHLNIMMTMMMMNHIRSIDQQQQQQNEQNLNDWLFFLVHPDLRYIYIKIRRNSKVNFFLFCACFFSQKKTFFSCKSKFLSL